MKTLIVPIVALALVAGCKKNHEHAGNPATSEHAGKEHAGTAAGKSAQQIKDAMNAHIKAQTKDGVFTIKDDKTGETLSLTFVKIHDPVRKIEKSATLPTGYFACTDFAVKGSPDKLYDLDFWLNEELKVTDTRIHKHPEQVSGKWEKKARYTFVDDKPVEIK